MAEHKVRAAHCGDRHEARWNQRAQENDQDRGDRDQIPHGSVSECEARTHLNQKYANQGWGENPQYPRRGIGYRGSGISAGRRSEIARPVNPGRAMRDP